MASWVLIPCLKQLFDDFDDAYPGRDHTTDGSVGDDAHSGSSSDHNPDESGNTPHEDSDSKNEVHAIDVDKDLGGGGSMEDEVQGILARCRSGEEDRLHYIIFNCRIWEESNDWRERDYTGSNRHDKHAHFSACYETDRESDTSSWGIGGGDVAAEKDMITITADCAAEIGKQAGDEVSLATLAQLSVIHAARSADDAKQANDRVALLIEELNNS